ncbi:glycosyltransferase family 2 protein [Phaeobacter sp. C3_T13_0]|uniref:glycosyltransferase family 2 protein n=1 Tax=Phaeobacter cretensis TaxID=3342641 RepID=UPI0039BCC910
MHEPAGQGPLISIIMANHQGAGYLGAALRSVVAQTYVNWELIVADDGSSDGSVAILQDVAAQDARVRVLLHETPSGPAAARNRALAAAGGDWVAICDSDDVMHPDRLRRLLAAAEELDADAVADDMIHFATEPLAGPRRVLGDDAPDVARKIEAADMLRVPELGESGGQLGYLKPLIRRSALGALRYDETLQIGEDQDFYLQLLLQGAGFWLVPEALYLYRRHPQSLSHRSNRAQVAATLAALAALCARLSPDQMFELEGVITHRRRVLQGRLAFETLAEHLKTRHYDRALAQILRHPSLIPRLARVAMAKVRSTGVGQGGAIPVRAGEILHLVGPGGHLPETNHGQRTIEVPDPAADHGCGALWAELCHLASLTELTLTYGDAAGLSAAWRVPGVVHILARGPVISDLSPPKGWRDD